MRKGLLLLEGDTSNGTPILRSGYFGRLAGALALPPTLTNWSRRLALAATSPCLGTSEATEPLGLGARRTPEARGLHEPALMAPARVFAGGESWDQMTMLGKS